MIGVIVDRRQDGVVREFFELFKTPWEFYRRGRRYDAIVVAGAPLPEVEGQLIVVYGSKPTGSDREIGVAGQACRQGTILQYRGIDVPLYREVLTLEGGRGASPCLLSGKEAVGLRTRKGGTEIIRVGYDVFDEVGVLLSRGQPSGRAGVPTLDIHIEMLRQWILDAGIALVEIPPTPSGHPMVACLTHDIDFAGLRYHGVDHTVLGFLYRSTIGAAGRFLRGRLSLSRLVACWRAALTLPFVYLGWARDFWEPFGWYLQVERGLPATYFVIPFRRRPGDKVESTHAARRGSAYDVDDLGTTIPRLLAAGCEVGVHGIDAWHSVDRGRKELERVGSLTSESRVGVRMHWLLQDEGTSDVLERAGYAYDSSVGYNETIGYRSGTSQVFRPSGARTLLELPLHIQDGALFFQGRLDLTDAEAWGRCAPVLEHGKRLGGVVTTLWHDRSHAAERFWGDFYLRLVEALRASGAWFGTGSQVVEWFRKRREIRFSEMRAADGTVHVAAVYEGEPIVPPVRLRIHQPGGRGSASGQSGARYVDMPWQGGAPVDLGSVADPPAVTAGVGAAS